MTCGECPVGKRQSLGIISCPFDDKYFHGKDDKCMHENERMQFEIALDAWRCKEEKDCG